jgi:hypothetical protein
MRQLMVGLRYYTEGQLVRQVHLPPTISTLVDVLAICQVQCADFTLGQYWAIVPVADDAMVAQVDRLKVHLISNGCCSVSPVQAVVGKRGHAQAVPPGSEESMSILLEPRVIESVGPLSRCAGGGQ